MIGHRFGGGSYGYFNSICHDAACEELARGIYVVEICSFKELNEIERGACIEILRHGGAVDTESAKRELPLAPTLAVLRLAGEIVGLGAIKRARPKYALGVMRDSGFSFNQYLKELGYVAVDEKHRGHKLSQPIVGALLSKDNGSLFATTDNESMKATLRDAGFVAKGNEWRGTRGALSLWMRD